MKEEEEEEEEEEADSFRSERGETNCKQIPLLFD
jgi:hypothetical protein